MSQETLDLGPHVQVVLTHCNGGDGPWEAEVYFHGRLALFYHADYEHVRADALVLVDALTTR